MQAWSPLAETKHKVLEDKVINEISNKHKKTPAEVILRWITQNGHVTFPKADDVEKLRENLNIFDFKLTEEEMKAMDQRHHEVKVEHPDEFKYMYV